MNGCRRIALLTTWAVAAAAWGWAAEPRFDATDKYIAREVEGFRVLVHPLLLPQGGEQADVDLGKRLLEELRSQLFEIERRVPAAAVEKLRRVTIWAEFDEPHHPCMAYHPDAEWLREHNMNPDKARSVEIANAQRFVSWSIEQPWMVLHELAHAYHHQFLDAPQNARIDAAWKQAKQSGRYDSVLHIQGKTVRHYALNNPQEYFAEGSEAFFGTNDHFPFVRAELAVHDQVLFELLEDVWGAPKRPGK